MKKLIRKSIKKQGSSDKPLKFSGCGSDNIIIVTLMDFKMDGFNT